MVSIIVKDFFAFSYGSNCAHNRIGTENEWQFTSNLEKAYYFSIQLTSSNAVLR